LSVHREGGPGAAEVHGVKVSVSKEGTNYLQPLPAQKGVAAKGEMYLSFSRWSQSRVHTTQRN